MIYRSIGPDEAGNYHVAYPTPGVPHVLSVRGQSGSKRLVEDECARLNTKRTDETRRIVCDLTSGEKGPEDGR